MKSMSLFAISNTVEDSRHKIAVDPVRTFGFLDGVPGFYTEKAGTWAFAGANGILIPLYDPAGNLYRPRLCLERPKVDEHGKEKNKL